MSGDDHNNTTETRCDCGHPVSAHDNTGRCQEWWRYPDVLDARQCGCTSVRGEVSR